MSRIAHLLREQMDGEQRRIFDLISNGPRGAVAGPLAAWLHSPGLADRAQALGVYCRYESRLLPRLSELAILVVGAYWQSGFEWVVHAREARAAGLSDQVIDAIRERRVPPLDQLDEAAVYHFASDLMQNRRVSSIRFNAAAELLGNAALVDLVGILGYYTLICMTINAFELPPPAGVSDPFAGADTL